MERKTTMSKHFSAEALFLDPADVPLAVAQLEAAGCQFQVYPDAVDPCGPTVFGRISGTTELGSEHELGDWLMEIVHALSGDVDEVGFDDPVNLGKAT
jgi:hypothetical protein